jgi:hypothetical protein
VNDKELAKKLFGATEQSMGVIQALKEAAQAIGGAALEGAKTLGKGAWNELDNQIPAGAHELAAALFNGNQGGTGFVMYPRGTREDHGVHGPEEPDHGLGNKGIEPQKMDGKGIGGM